MMTSDTDRNVPIPGSPYLVAQPEFRTEHRNAAIILMATDATERSDGALRVAAARAAATGATLELLTIAEPEPMVAVDGLNLVESDAMRRWTLQRTDVERQVERVLGRDTILSITVLDGNPAYTISRVAIERRAAMVVVGLGRHRIADRILGDETTLQLTRISRVPVLAVPAHVVVPPAYAVVAVDFSDLSIRAAQSAIETVADDGRVDLVHVMPRTDDGAFAVEGEEPYERWATQHLAVLAAKLVVPDGMQVGQVTLRGRAAPALIAYATRVGADLISTGTHGRGFVARALLGSVTTKLLRHSTCTTLTLPRDPLPVFGALAALPAASIDAFDSPLAWTRLLNDFTRRNAGRRTILEVDDLEIGAQAQEYNYPLLGASYNARAGRFDLMLGDRVAGGRHLSRSIGNVAALDVLTNADGSDVALRVQHGASQTLLTFALP